MKTTTAAQITVGDIVVDRYTAQNAGSLGAMRAGRVVEIVNEMEVLRVVGMGSSVDRRGLRSTWKRTDQPAPFIAIYFKAGRAQILRADSIVEVAR
ncbi:hypothetical protein [Arenimonas sp.]|jgi:hypothetical protein|uniref:hypothetical protein n=1 Tax=Arenimonas sp. TaxID=1872635 RepID=UPI0037C117F5